VVRKRAEHFGEFFDIGAAAAKLGGHAGLHQAGRLQGGEVVGDEAILVGGFVGALGEDWPECARDLDGRANLDGLGRGSSGGVHENLHKRPNLRLVSPTLALHSSPRSALPELLGSVRCCLSTSFCRRSDRPGGRGYTICTWYLSVLG